MSHMFCLIIEADSFPTVIPGAPLSRRKLQFSSPPSVTIVPPSPNSSPVIPGVTIPLPRPQPRRSDPWGSLPPGFIPQTITDPSGVTPTWQPGTLPPISIEPPSPSSSPVIPGVTIPMPQPPPRRSDPWGSLPPGFIPQTITEPNGVSTPIWQPGTFPPISIEPPSPYSSSLAEGSYSPYQRSYKPWPSPATLPRCSALSSSQDATFRAEADALRERQLQLYELFELELLNLDVSTSSCSRSTCFAGPTADEPHAGDAHSTGPSSPHLLRPNTSYLYGGTPGGELGSSGGLSFVEFDLDDAGVLEPDRVLNVSRQRDNSSTKHEEEENLSFSLGSWDQERLESVEDSMNLLGLWGVPLMSQPSLDEG